jgi:hypothetical protein
MGRRAAPGDQGARAAPEIRISEERRLRRNRPTPVSVLGRAKLRQRGARPPFLRSETGAGLGHPFVSAHGLGCDPHKPPPEAGG